MAFNVKVGVSHSGNFSPTILAPVAISSSILGPLKDINYPDSLALLG